MRNLLELYEYHVPEKLPTVEGIFAEALAREGNGSKTDFYIVLARYYELVQQPQKAIATLEKMKTAFPDDREVQKLANEQIKKLSSR